jgi:hypothetical protein
MLIFLVEHGHIYGLLLCLVGSVLLLERPPRWHWAISSRNLSSCDQLALGLLVCLVREDLLTLRVNDVHD